MGPSGAPWKPDGQEAAAVAWVTGQRWPGRCTWTETGPLTPGRHGGTVLRARRWAGWQVQRVEGKREHEGDAWRVTGHGEEDVVGERGSLRRK